MASAARLPLPQRAFGVGYDLAFEFALWGPGRLPSSQSNLEEFFQKKKILFNPLKCYCSSSEAWDFFVAVSPCSNDFFFLSGWV